MNISSYKKLPTKPFGELGFPFDPTVIFSQSVSDIIASYHAKVGKRFATKDSPICIMYFLKKLKL